MTIVVITVIIIFLFLNFVLHRKTLSSIVGALLFSLVPIFLLKQADNSSRIYDGMAADLYITFVSTSVLIYTCIRISQDNRQLI